MHSLDHAGEHPRKARKRDAEAHATQRSDFEAHASQRRIQHEIVERDQQHHQQRIQRLHLSGSLHQQARPPPWSCGMTMVVALQHPGRGLLVEQRPERRDEREDDQNAQHRAHAVDHLVRMGPRARSSCSEVPTPPNSRSGTERQTERNDETEILRPPDGDRASNPQHADAINTAGDYATRPVRARVASRSAVFANVDSASGSVASEAR